AGFAFAAIAAAPAGDVEGHGDEIADFEHLDIAAFFDHFAGDLMTQDEALRGGGAAAHHVLVRSADVGGHHLENDAVGGVFAAERIGLTLGHSELGEGDGLNLHYSRFNVSDSTIGC